MSEGTLVGIHSGREEVYFSDSDVGCCRRSREFKLEDYESPFQSYAASQPLAVTGSELVCLTRLFDVYDKIYQTLDLRAAETDPEPLERKIMSC